MIELPIKPSQQISAGLLLYGYAALLSGAYTFGYWTTFGFNPFPYLNAKDIITAPLSNLLFLLAPFILIMPVGMLDQSDRAKDIKSFRVMLYVHWLLYLGIIIESLYLAWSNGINYSNERRVMAISALMVMASFGISRRFALERKQIYFPFLSVAFAQLAIVVTGGYQGGKSVTSESSLIKRDLQVYALNEFGLCGSDSQSQWVYLERYGDYAVFYNRAKRTLCVSDSRRYTLSPTQINLIRITP